MEKLKYPIKHLNRVFFIAVFKYKEQDKLKSTYSKKNGLTLHI
jgi:hypothetical protein